MREKIFKQLDEIDNTICKLKDLINQSGFHVPTVYLTVHKGIIVKAYATEKIILSKDVNLKQLSQQFELSGADIMNVVQHVCLNALSKDSLTVSNEDIIHGIQREFIKSGKIC